MNPRPPSPPADGVRKPVLLVLVAVALVGAGLIFLKTRPAPPEPTEPAVEEVAEAPAPKPVPAPPEATPPAAAAPAPVVRPAAPSGPEPTPESRRLVSLLANLDLKSAPLTPQAAAEFRKNLLTLAQGGAASVPAIQEFLALNKDVSFDTVPGAAEQLGFSSLRMALLEGLEVIGGPEALALSVQTLQRTTDPREIALLAQSLERQAPEQYREMALAAARAALAQSPQQLNGRDVGPLFNLLTQFGGVNALADFQQAADGQWKHYATIALANLPDGAGVPGLIQLVNDPRNAANGGNLAAIQALGQAAAENTEARDALLAQARLGKVPSSSWINIAASLAGERFEIGNAPTGLQPNVRTWHLNFGNQNYFSQPQPLTGDQINERLAVMDQFISSNPGEAATKALQEARTRLQGRQPGG